MTIIDRYLVQTIIRSSLLTLLILVGLVSFVNFVTQTDDIGEGTYEVGDAIAYVLLLSPQHAFELLPIAALIGTLMGLGNLAAHSELVVMRTAGVSRLRLSGSTLLSGLVLVVLAVILGEVIGPPAEQLGRTQRALKKHSQLTVTGGRYAWVKDGNTFVNFQPMGEQGDIGGIFLFRFDDDQELRSVARASGGAFDEDKQWQLVDYRETRIDGDRVRTRARRRITQASGLSPDVLGLSIVNPDQLGSVGLFNYVAYLKANNMDSQPFEVAAWSRLANTVSILVMTVLALPFAFGGLRSAGAGARLVTGIVMGSAFFFASQTLSSSGQVFGLNPLVIAWLPTLIVGLIAIGGVSRIR